MFLRTGITGIRGFLDLTAFFTSGKDIPPAQKTTANQRSITLWDEAADTQATPECVVIDEPSLDKGKAAEWNRERRSLVLEGFAVEEVTELCMTHDYRWRCLPSQDPTPSFLLSPVATKPVAQGE